MEYSRVIQPYVDALNRLLNTVVTDSRLDTIEGPAASLIIARFQRPDVVPLELRGGKWLHFRQRVEEDGQAHLNVLEARYILANDPDIDKESSHVFRWEYLREPPGPHVPYAHLHVNGENGLYHVHFPTRRLSFEQILWLVIQEYRVPPKDPNTWYDTLRKGHLDFLKRVRDSEDALQPFP